MQKKSILILGLIILLLFLGYFFLGGKGDDHSEMVDESTDTMMEDSEEQAEMDDSMENMESSDEEMSDSEEMEGATKGGDTMEGEVKEFTVDSFNFGYSMEEIRVNEGDTVTINLTNSDGFHDWVVDEFSAATEKIQAGQTTSVTFVASAAGEYEYYCSVGSHRANGMVGKLIVE